MPVKQPEPPIPPSPDIVKSDRAPDPFPAFQPASKGTEFNASGTPARRSPDGCAAFARGFIWQRQIACDYEQQGYHVREGYRKDEPDILLYRDKEMATPLKVVSVKSFSLVPYSLRDEVQRAVTEGVTKDVTPLFRAKEGVGRGKRKHAWASGRRITRSDVEPELRIARVLGIECELVVVNQRNGGRGRWGVTADFEGLNVNDKDLKVEAKGATE